MAKSYEEAGVKLEAGYEVVRRIKSHVASTARTGSMGNIGSFGGMFDLAALGLKEPVLVSGTDGVGTKLKIAFAMDKHDTVGIDAVAMCVNDVLAQGAEPLFFLDYVALGENVPAKVEAIVAGVAEGCRQAGCALVGGETAEMPGMYAGGEYDIAGFTTGVVEKSRLIDGTKVAVGDVLVGVASSGVHSNGFSLVRKIVTDAGLAYTDPVPELGGRRLGDVLLTPTKIYVKQMLGVIRASSATSPAAVSTRTSRACCARDRASRSARAAGRSSRCSACSSGSAASPTGRCSTSSTWASGWSPSSRLPSPPGSGRGKGLGHRSGNG